MSFGGMFMGKEESKQEEMKKEEVNREESKKDSSDNKKEVPVVEAPKKEPKSKDEIIKDLTNTLQRLQAEFENYSKRVDKECKDFRKFAKAELVVKLLPTLDSFELALKNNQDPEKFKKGVEMIYAQLYQILEDEGLRKIDVKGKKFDHNYHEVLLTEDCEGKEDEAILEELQKGYMLGDRVVRYSKVKVCKREGKR